MLLHNLPRLIMSNFTKNPRVLFVLGPPGAGKGTQCTKISKEYNFVHLSAGDLLREERSKEGSKYGELIESRIKNGLIVPVEITCNLIHQAMVDSQKRNFLIDGFPRNQDNIDGWTRVFGNNVNLLGVLFFDAPENVCGQRILSRGAAGSGRTDDNPETVKKRFVTYMNDTLPIMNFYEDQSLVHRIDASRSPEEIFADVRNVFSGLTLHD